MLSNLDVGPTLPTADLTRARAFYEGVLGLTPDIDLGESGVVYRSGATQLLVFVTPNAGTNKATAASWTTDDVDGEVAALRAKGVEFQTFEWEGITWDNGVATMPDGVKSAWFSDPDGNVLAIGTFPR